MIGNASSAPDRPLFDNVNAGPASGQKKNIAEYLFDLIKIGCEHFCCD